MIDRNILRAISAALAAAVLSLAAAGSADAARVNRSPNAGTTTTKQGQSAPHWGGGGYRWCYWHPYVCAHRR